MAPSKKKNLVKALKKNKNKSLVADYKATLFTTFQREVIALCSQIPRGPYLLIQLSIGNYYTYLFNCRKSVYLQCNCQCA